MNRVARRVQRRVGGLVRRVEGFSHHPPIATRQVDVHVERIDPAPVKDPLVDLSDQINLIFSAIRSLAQSQISPVRLSLINEPFIELDGALRRLIEVHLSRPCSVFFFDCILSTVRNLHVLLHSEWIDLDIVLLRHSNLSFNAVSSWEVSDFSTLWMS